MSISPSLLSACRNRDVQGNFIAPSFKVYINPLINITNLAGSLDNPTVSIVRSDSDFSVSGSYVNLTTSEEDGVYTHSLVFTIYSVSDEVRTNLTSIVNLLQDEIYQFRTPCFVYSDSYGDHLISPESFNLTYSLNQSSEGQSIEVTLKAVSSYPAIDVIPLVIPKTYVHIRGHLDPSYITNNGGFTVNDTPYYYKDLELDGDNAFDIAIEEPVTMENFSAEWAYGVYNPSPLVDIDLSEFDGKESLTSLESAFKDNTNLESVILPSCGSVTTYDSAFSGCTHLTSVDGVPSFNGVTSFSSCFFNCTSLQSFSFGSWNIKSSPDCTFMFAGCSSLVSIDTDKLITVGSLMQMFSGCTSLQSLNLWTKTWAPTDCDAMFNGCSNLTNLSMWQMDLSDASATPGAYSSVGMFNGCPSNLQIGFPSNHAHGYDLVTIGNASLASYFGTIALLDASYAGTYKSVVLSSEQDEYINSIPLLQSYRVQAQAKGWSIWHV